MSDVAINSDGGGGSQLSQPTAPSVRWWPAAVIVAIASAVIGLTRVLWPEDVEQGHFTIIVAVTLFVSLISLASWLVFFSGMSKSARKRSLIVLAVATVVFAGSFRIPTGPAVHHPPGTGYIPG